MKPYLPSKIIKNGFKPESTDHRDYSFPRMFGSVTIFKKELNLDAGLTNRSQNGDGYPNGCTGYAQTDLCVDEDKIIYDPIYTYHKTLFMENKKPDSNQGASLRDSLKSTIIYGVMPVDGKDKNPYAHRRGAYANVRDVTELDAFDDIRSAIQKNNRSVSIGTPWFYEWSATGKDGIIQDIDFLKYSKRVLFRNGLALTTQHPWHNYKICGWKEINGEPYLIAKVWLGKNWGDNGFCYFSRKTVNMMMQILGTDAFTLVRLTDATIANVKFTTLQFIMSFLRRIVKLKV